MKGNKEIILKILAIDKEKLIPWKIRNDRVVLFKN